MAVLDAPRATTEMAVEPADSSRPLDRRLAALTEQVHDLDRQVENNRLIRDTWTLIIFAIAAVALFVSVFAVGLGMRAINEADGALSPPTAPQEEVSAHVRA